MKKIMSNEDYHADPAIGSTLLKSISNRSIAHALLETKESDALILGSALHAAILEPETYEDNYIVAPKIDRRTKAGKLDWASFLEEADGKQVLTADMSEKVQAMKTSLLNHPKAILLLTGGESEYSYFSKCPHTGLMKKCRPDYKKADALIDLKTAQDASSEGFTRAAMNRAYHIQAAHYVDTYNEASDEKVKEFYFVVVENTAPYAVNTFKLGEIELSLGREQAKKAIEKYADYLNSSEKDLVKFGYGLSTEEIQFPDWYLLKQEA